VIQQIEQQSPITMARIELYGTIREVREQMGEES
jgi:hypothetical protein